jgi:DNA-directed RNA polymerase sigma subunit (sigma70/sigma32)
VNPDTGSIKLNFPHLKVWELEESCALDHVTPSGLTLEEVADLMNLTRERVRQIECMGIARVKREHVRMERLLRQG